MSTDLKEHREECSPSFLVRLIGTFAIMTRNGRPIVIKNSKNKALLVLLLTAPGQQRSRRWLEATLWSTREDKEAGQSLRTALSSLKKSLSSTESAIGSDRSNIWLGPGSFKVDLFGNNITHSDPDILEGLDVKDEQFEAWLTEFRREYEAKRTPDPHQDQSEFPARGIEFISRIDGGLNRDEQYLAESIVDLVDQSVSESIGRGLERLHPRHRSSRTGILLRTSVINKRGVARLAMRLEVANTKKRIWDARATVDCGEPELLDQIELLKIVYGASSAMISALPKLPGIHNTTDADAEIFLSRAIVQMFTFDPANLRASEALMNAAAIRIRHPVLKAWQSLLYQFMVAERLTADVENFKKLSEQYACEALSQEPDNANILAIVSVVNQLLGCDAGEGLALSRRALFLNPGNAMAHIALSIALLREGRANEAKEAVERAKSISSYSPFQHWIEMFHCLAAILCEDYDLAVRTAEAAASRTKDFRAPLRHLYALHLNNGNIGMAKKVVAQIKLTEPDFSMRLIRQNAEYPASTIRNSRLVEARDPE
ncbi:MAG: hypothetical protein AAF468_17005 [Pseudomonadota bacterium]